MHWIDRILIPNWDRGIIKALKDDYSIKQDSPVVTPQSDGTQSIAAG